MKEIIDVAVGADEQVVLMADEIVYGQRKEWCDAGMRQLSLGLLKYRQFYSYDNHKKLPLIIWLCGGAFSEMKRNIWAPEMVNYAKHGYAVALVEYTVNQRMRFPEPIVDVMLNRWFSHCGTLWNGLGAVRSGHDVQYHDCAGAWRIPG